MKTPQLPAPELAKALGLNTELWLKREDKHHYGSHKGRSIPLMITTHIKNGTRSFVVSSSGNAALAAVRAIKTYNKNKGKEPASLTIFIGKNIDATKHKLLLSDVQGDSTFTVVQADNPKQQALQFSKEKNAAYLRQSADDTALLGYEELANELGKIEKLAAVFIPTSSGTTALGLYNGFQKLGINPAINIVQTTFCHPIADLVIDTSAIKKEDSLATAIVDIVALRKTSVADSVKKSDGGAFVATNDEIKAATDLVKKTTGEAISPNSALSIVGIMQAIKKGRQWNGPVVCLITGQ